MVFERYWIFALCCLLVLAFVLRLILRERVTLQHSLAFLVLMLVILTAAVFPTFTFGVAKLMGFTLLSNFFFAIVIGALVLLHLGTLIALSKLESRSITITQELGLIQEQLTRLSAEGAQKHPSGHANDPADSGRGGTRTE